MIRHRVNWQRPHVRVVVCLRQRLVHDKIPNEHRIEQAESVAHLHLLGKYQKLLLTSKNNGFIV